MPLAIGASGIFFSYTEEARIIGTLAMGLNYDLKLFMANDDGAVTVDWVVLSGAVVALGLGVLVLIEPGVENSTEVVSNAIGTAVVDRVSANSEIGLD